jgi:hypothetical protein
MRAIGDIVKQMKRELSPRRRRVIAAAYHEAGHAVAALMLGDEVLEVRINADAREHTDLSGHVTRRNPLYAPSERLKDREWLKFDDIDADAVKFRKSWEVNLIVAIAGRLAQRRHDPKSIRPNQVREDNSDIEEMLGGLGSPTEREHYRQWGKHMAAKIIGECWTAVESVATSLLQHNGILTGHQLKQIANVAASNVVVTRD